ncbi:Zn(II)2Cys6 transcription factor domain-containing protein [Aspergillus saccharolyticus JOP 1030-1]|uniref:Zn(2)-C6 fungal-type domain-containing protein n=1 Tax=Aspergillus saccharolyticus JOP 1030-1 TaxID=1450539 RepID=A0A318ZI28_9EURO|nr:hypothetical protein BP01DRAFT_34572 [Aspergillus saccharolyticus JOP 1030-1]PYH46044.1 hypothetical protein BP01DRAFT_34572 [Aspergillus saccharolyticus JOP 1030-1]
MKHTILLLDGPSRSYDPSFLSLFLTLREKCGTTIQATKRKLHSRKDNKCAAHGRARVVGPVASARRVKCDETPGHCYNCSSTGRTCEGYDPTPLPRPNTSQRHRGIYPHLPPTVTTEIRWLTTADERRCFAFFQSRTIPDILGAFDSPLWHQLVLQIARLDPAVCHAAMALAAVHQECQNTGMGLRPLEKHSPWNLFAYDQAARSFALLRRRNPRDPQVPQVVLLACILFVMLNLVWREYDAAFRHLRSGLRILGELHRQGMPVFQNGQGSPVDWHIVTALRQLDIQSTQFGCDAPLLETREEARLAPTAAQWQTIRSVAEGRRALDPLTTLTHEYLKRGWSSEKERDPARYASLHREQLALISLLNQAKRAMHEFHIRQYASLSPRDQVGADILKVNLHWLCLGLRAAFVLPGPAYLASIASECHHILTTSEGVIAKLAPRRPAILFDTGIISPLFLVASLSPEFSDRWRAILALHAWPHCEGPYSSAFHAHLAEKMLKGDLRARIRAELTTARGKPPNPQLLEDQLAERLTAITGRPELQIDEEIEQYLDDLTQPMAGWPCAPLLIRAGVLSDRQFVP